MKILHLASHTGNIGDNASHIGFYNILKQIGIQNFEIDKLEIRKFYSNYNAVDKQSFDYDFAQSVNQYDLFVIGGGGFLDYWVENSATGTTLNISPVVLEKIKTPIFISSVGCMPHKRVPDGNIEKFRNFLDKLLSKKNVFIAVRNDGSKDTLRDYVGKKYYDNIPEVLDHGFFYENDGSYYRPSQRPYVLINSTVDQIKMNNRAIGKIDEGNYVHQMREFIQYLIRKTDYDIVFAPHIYSDYRAIQGLLEEVGDFVLRSRIVVTPYVQGDYGCHQIFSAYYNSNVVFGMRFHSNVCSFAMKVPSIGIAVLDRVVSLYEHVGLIDNAVIADNTFNTKIIERLKFFEDNNFGRIQNEKIELLKRETLELYQKAFTELNIS